MEGSQVTVKLTLPGAFVIGGWHEYEVYLDRVCLGKTSYSRGIDLRLSILPGAHELVIQRPGCSPRTTRSFPLNFPHPGTYSARVVFSSWWGRWRVPEITRLT